MTEEERLEEDQRMGTDHTQKKQSVAYNFMQKYYHKGAFYQNSDDEDAAGIDPSGGPKSTNDLKNRDYNLPTMEDKIDRSVLPQLLQKRMGTFGRKGNSKWTHLTAEDTTNYDPRTRVAEHIAKK